MALYDGTNAPLIKVYLDSGNRTSGFFTLGWSTLAPTGTDVLGQYTPFTILKQFPTTDVKHIAIRRGRTREDQQIQPGTLTLTMDNTSGSYDPEYAKGATVTAASGNGTTVTYTSANDFAVGEIVSIRNLSVSALNLTLQTIVSASSTQFTVSNSATGSCSGQSATANTGWFYFDPNTATVNSLLVAGTGIRVTATITGYYEVSLFTGYIEQVDKDMSLEPITTISCVDGLAMLAKMFSDIDTTNLQISTAISRILDDAGWNRNFYYSNDNIAVSKLPTGDVLTMIDPIVTTQPGAMFLCTIAGDAAYLGYSVFNTGSWTSPKFTMTDTRASTDVVEYDTISVTGGEKYRRNQVTINNTNPDGSAGTRTKFNQPSVARYGPFAAQFDTYYSDVYYTSGVLATIAQRLADQFAESEYRVDSIGFECVGFSAALWYNIITSDLGSAVAVSRTPIYSNGYAFDYQCYIQEINHDINPNSWRMALS